MVDTCAFLYFDNGVKLFDPSDSNMDYNVDVSEKNYWEMQTKSSPSHNFKEYLKHIFLKVTSIFSSSDAFDYKVGGSQEISGSSVKRDPEEKFIAVYPKIPSDKVQLTNSIGVPVSKTGDVYNVPSAGFYTLSFNTVVDLEQVPISELTIRMKKITSQWNVKEGFVELTNIDPVPPESGSTHRIFRYLSPGEYQILIKVEDNWGFYSCAGLSGFSDPNKMTPTKDCYNCCVTNNFLDNLNETPPNEACRGCNVF